MENFICVQCGAQYGATAEPPPHCTICEDERQFVRYGGQDWITLDPPASDHHNPAEDGTPPLLRVRTQPEFATRQRALLFPSPRGSLLLHFRSLLDHHHPPQVNA